MENILEITLPIHTVSEANISEHWTKKKKRHDIQKKAIWIYFKKEKPEISLPCRIKLTRIGKRKLDDDNLPVSMKWIRDEISSCLIPGKLPGRADDDKRISFCYDQKIGKEYGINIIFYCALQ